MEKELTHPLFYQKLKNLKSNTVAKLANRILSLGGASYYFFDEHLTTKIVLFNYASLYAGQDFAADWQVVLYSKDGKNIFQKKGRFTKKEMAIIDLDEVRPNSEYGIVVAHIKPCDKGRILGKTFDTVFFTEHHRRNGLWHDIAHSLRWPTALKYHYTISGHGISLLPDARPYLLIGNSYHTKTPALPVLCRPLVEVINHQGETRQVKVATIRPMGCQRVDLLKLFPDMQEFLGSKPGMVRVSGQNIFRKPFFFQTNGEYIASDHL